MAVLGGLYARACKTARCVRRIGGVLLPWLIQVCVGAFLAERQQLHHIESEGRTDFLTVTSRTGILSLG